MPPLAFSREGDSYLSVDCATLPPKDVYALLQVIVTHNIQVVKFPTETSSTIELRIGDGKPRELHIEDVSLWMDGITGVEIRTQAGEQKLGRTSALLLTLEAGTDPADVEQQLRQYFEEMYQRRNDNEVAIRSY